MTRRTRYTPCPMFSSTSAPPTAASIKGFACHFASCLRFTHIAFTSSNVAGGPAGGSRPRNGPRPPHPASPRPPRQGVPSGPRRPPPLSRQGVPSGPMRPPPLSRQGV
eukprot:331681-Prorocentrum_minimum.AAC.2